MKKHNDSGRPGDISQLQHNVDLLWFERVDTATSAKTLVLYLDLVYARACRPGNAGKAPKIHVLIVAGEATQDEYGEAEATFKKLLDLSNVKMEMVAGPVLNAARKDESTVLRLALQYPNKFKFYRVTMREDDHWKIAQVDGKPWLIQLECPHVPAPVDDCYKATLTNDGYYFTSAPKHVLDCDIKKRPFGSVFKFKSSISSQVTKWVPSSLSERKALEQGFDNECKAHITWFDRYREKHLASKWKLDHRNAEVLPTAKIQRAFKRMKRRGRLYDFSTETDILNLAK